MELPLFSNSNSNEQRSGEMTCGTELSCPRISFMICHGYCKSNCSRAVVVSVKGIWNLWDFSGNPIYVSKINNKKKKLEVCVILQLIDILKRGVYMASLSAY